MKILKNVAWGIITARGGSKSIPLKNLVPVCEKPLIGYTINAVKKAKTVSRIICSTDDEKIAATVKAKGVEVLHRPEHLSGDLAPSIDVMVDVAETIIEKEGEIADILLLLQPTSLFLTSEQIDKAVNALIDNPEAKSSQNVIKVPHQFHAHNQRVMYDNGKDIAFVYQKEREKGYSRQTKPVYYTYGNLIVTRTKSLIEDKTFFGRPSIPITIPLYSAYDLDTQEDIKLAELMIKNKLVEID
jgi:CMP-N-acetylneuraminic acid synthetase